MIEDKRSDAYPLRRRDVVKRLIHADDDLLVIAGLGSTAWDITSAGDRDLNFPLWGAMGGAISMGLGLALAQPRRRVLVITGDGETLMGLGSLASVALQGPQNLSICTFDNERYGETGMQLTHTSAKTDLAGVAKACGIAVTGEVRTEDELEAALPAILEAPGPVYHAIKVRAEKLDFVLPPNDGEHLKDRFRLALLGAC
ncbi:MAG: aldehyde dehydrogenase [Rhodospirillaceae bacterium]|jgi:thiamine pyrophosphate-dependent acetolactate synthase large subunit-like protein|nr:aldehyde dehydrogenase [Rhodospirillaceae bacterium]MBT5244308.1 aldehyde dehydrogenase [Rhodospirillaceae bacterium]MBT5563669.1 aldehyde dehydrogenase [Rhodospirillaceae bacterium]MBT6241499.1 aldehyde dehydrogenase [Rhodospirillaceae bacterium]MBT7137085.1 aldehyde dehydrogenase [Rhodospirillaceae bacterium]